MIKKIIEKRIKEKTIVLVCVIFFLLQIIPILYLGQYDHPTSDDFQYGAASHTVWQDTHSLLLTVEAAAQGVAEDYQRWQGSYSALFLMRLEPTVFAEWCYGLVPFLMIGLLTAGTLYLMHTLFYDLLKSRSWHWITAALLLVMLSIQFSLVASEQFFWYNSSIYYNAYHAFMLFYLAWFIKYSRTAKKRYLCYLLFFGIVIGGGNYITALTTALGMLTGILLLIIEGKRIDSSPGSQKKRGVQIVLLGLLWVELVVAFVISAIAPGNAARAETTGGYGAVSAIVHSLLQGTNYYLTWLDKWWLLVILLLSPIMIRMIRKIKFSFSYPVLVLLYFYGFFCAMSCPTFYALGSTGPGRVVNIIYDAFLWISGFQFFYVLGWFIRRLEKIDTFDLIHFKKLFYQINYATIGLLILFLIGSGSCMDTTTITALKVWIKGEGKQYDTEYKERLAVLEDETISDVVFEPYTVEPALVFIADGTEDPTFVNNREWADFYGKNSLVIKSDSEDTNGN